MQIDYTKYPPDWHSRIRPAVLERAGNCCEVCGVANHTLKENGTKVILTIAHLDHDSDNWQVELDRLKAMCQACHLGYDRPRHVRKRKYGMQVYKQPKFFKSDQHEHS